jgi:hypothetical protein
LRLCCAVSCGFEALGMQVRQEETPFFKSYITPLFDHNDPCHGVAGYEMG